MGRGALAGPVVAAAVVLPDGISNHLEALARDKVFIKDSKKLTLKARETACIWIKKECIWALGSASASTIDRLGIVPAANIAFRQAVHGLMKKSGRKIEHLFVDAFFIPRIKGVPKARQSAIIKGDEKVLQISAASIVAKVARDKIMADLGAASKYQKYLWIKNKGYGTREHMLAISTFGTSRHHRESFVKKIKLS